MSQYNPGDLVWFVDRDGMSARIGLGEVVKMTRTAYGERCEVVWFDSEGDKMRSDLPAEALTPDSGFDVGASGPMADTVKLIRLERAAALVTKDGREAIVRSCCRAGVDVYLRDEFRLDGSDLLVLLAAGLAAHFPGDRMAVLTDLGEHVAQQEL